MAMCWFGGGFGRTNRWAWTSVFATLEPQFLETAIAPKWVAAGKEAIVRALCVDWRLGDLFSRYGVAPEYVFAFRYRTLSVGDITEEGPLRSVSWCRKVWWEICPVFHKPV